MIAVNKLYILYIVGCFFLHYCRINEFRPFSRDKSKKEKKTTTTKYGKCKHFFSTFTTNTAK